MLQHSKQIQLITSFTILLAGPGHSCTYNSIGQSPSPPPLHRAKLMRSTGSKLTGTVPSLAISYIPSATVSQHHHSHCKDSSLGWLLWCPPFLYFHFKEQLCGHTTGSCGPFSSDLPDHCNRGSSSTTACEPRTVCNLVTSVLPAPHLQPWATVSH